MRLTPVARVVAVAVLLLVATAILWWVAGYRIGAALLNDAPAWRAYGYGALGLVRLFALALAVPVAIAVAASAGAQVRWLALAAIAFGAVLLYGDRSPGDVLAVVLLVLGAAAVSEAAGTQQLVVAAAAAVLVAIAAISDLHLETGQRIIAIVVRAAFFYLPLLIGPSLIDRHVLKRPRS